MEKDFPIEAEVRLFAHWHNAAESSEEYTKRVAIDDRLGVIACDLDEFVRVLVERLI